MRPKRTLPIILSAVLAMIARGWAAQQTAAPGSNVPPLPSDIPADANRSSVLMMGTLAGQQATWKTSDGQLHVFFQFNDRGRGPKTTTVFILGKNGNPVSEVIKGN